ncbi:MAG: M20/M25/M40 family metallo-hydrolase [Kiritimatiellae bacterium]|nr:M20/M25/M40 family metallo-hydrolase [Kiritimatiellia bacterium]
MEITNEQTAEWLKSNDSKEYFELLKFPTIGAAPEHLRDCSACATWLKKWLAATGADAEILLPGGGFHPPAVFAELKGGEGASTVLFYGHYDVQPPDPLPEWNTPPFEPTVIDGRVHCRGAQDDKGQFFAFLCGLRRFLASTAAERGTAPNLKIVLEGQEESGSSGLFKLLDERDFRRRLAADVMLVCDTSAAADLRPAIVAGLRGVNHFTVTLEAANRDLHSGEYGGIAPNAAQGMAELMASLHNDDGSIAVRGFLDGVEPPADGELAAAEAGMATEEMYATDIGTEPCGGVAGRSAVLRNCFEPTVELNGIHSGYGGPGSKTVIPCKALAKLSTRLVPGQNPRHAYETVVRHLEDHCPKGMNVAVSELTGEAPGFRLPLASPLFRLAAGVLSEIDARGAVFQWCGASIPVVSALREASGAAPLLVGWGQPEDRIHSPNESYSVRQFLLAREWAERILAAL